MKSNFLIVGPGSYRYSFSEWSAELDNTFNFIRPILQLADGRIPWLSGETNTNAWRQFRLKVAKRNSVFEKSNFEYARSIGRSDLDRARFLPISCCC